MAPVRVGIIGVRAVPEGDEAAPGAGTWAVTSHLPALQAMPEAYKIVAVCNSSVESAELAIRRYGLTDAKPYGNPSDLANDPDVDLVVISVNVGKHLDLAKPALEKKKNVFVEWPLGAGLAHAEELTRLAESAGVQASVGVQARADPLVVKVKNIVDSGTIGKVVNSSAWVASSVLDAWPEDVKYYLDLKSGGNQLFIWFGHFLDSFTHVLGDFAEVQAILKNKFTSVPLVNAQGEVVNPAYPKTSPDQIAVQGVLESDAVASISLRTSKTVTDGVSFRWVISGTKGELEVLVHYLWQFGEPKRTLKLKLGNDETQTVDFLAGDEFEGKVPMPGTNVARLYRALARGDTEKYATFKSALKTHQLLDRILKSAGWESV